jgi:hypothetical protein
MKRITKEPWFGNKTVGWGLSPVSWQGWVVTLILVLIVVMDVLYIHRILINLIIIIMAIVGFYMVLILTSELPTLTFRQKIFLNRIKWFVLLIAIIIMVRIIFLVGVLGFRPK